MLKKEIIWREILENAISKKKYLFTQKELAEKFGFSFSTVFNALSVPRAQGAVLVSGRSFSVTDMEKLLYIWATKRNLAGDIIYETHVPMNAKEMEGLAPAGCVFGGYSSYMEAHKDAPAEYDSVYFYADPSLVPEFRKRFPKEKGRPNLFVLKKDPFLELYGNRTTPDTQTFADLWNTRDWYAKDFLSALKAKMFV